MNPFGALGMGLGNLPIMSNAKFRSISAENPKGEKGGGARAELDGEPPQGASRELGVGWKVRPCITLPKNSKTTLVDIDGPGCIQHIWITVDPKAYRACTLRIWWDGEATPSVEAPLGDLFACGHGTRYKVDSIPLSVNPSGAFNSYWPMPFRKSCRVEVENEHWEDVGGFFYQFDYCLDEVPAEAAYFHAQWRRSVTSRETPEHLMLDGVTGKGHYVGTFIAWSQMSNGWWGEGEVKFFIDGDNDRHPTYCGTGTEDYFGGAWCFGETFTGPFLGYPLWDKREGDIPRHALYRWHVMDPVRFDKDFRATVQALGWWPGGKFQPLTDDVASVCYWYQAEPHGKFPAYSSLNDRWPR